MAFWSNLFGNKNVNTYNNVQTPMGSQDFTMNYEPVTPEPVAKPQTASESINTYHFNFVLSTEEQRNRIIDFISPLTKQDQILNLVLAYGVYDEENDAFLTRWYCTYSKDKNTGKTYGTDHCILLVKGQCMLVTFTHEQFKHDGPYTYETPAGYEELAKQAMEHWCKYKLCKEFEASLQTGEEKIILTKLNNDFKKPLSKIVKEAEKAAEEERLKNRKHYEIHNEEDARTLFFLCNTSYDKVLKENYDDETVATFEKYATSEVKKAWIVAECKEVLAKIAAGDTEELFDKLSTVSGKCGYWLSATDDDLAEEYTNTCEILFERNVDVPIKCINSYLQNFTNRMNPLHVKKLLDITEEYIKKNYADELAQINHHGFIGDFEECCAIIRGKIMELSPIDNSRGFTFVHTDKNYLSKILAKYLNMYSDMKAIKEELTFLNCVYGVENEDIFLTSASEEADNLNNRKWDMYDFMAVLKKDNKVISLRCKRNHPDGKLHVNHCKDEWKEYGDLIMDAIAFFRNKAERDAFIPVLEAENPGTPLFIVKKNAHKEFFSSFKAVYSKELKRIGDNPLAPTLKKMVNLCESKACEYGYKNTTFSKAATPEEIADWEEKNGIKLPEDYVNFLLFANGVQLLDDSTRIHGLNGIGIQDTQLEPGYLLIGSMIGDGTSLCIAASTDEAYIEDHGKYTAKGTFKDLLEYLMDFLEG